MAGLFAPTHVVPSGGLLAWAAPNAAQAAVATLDPGLDVVLLEQRDDGWAHVICSNGWSAWVDGRRLGALSRQDAPNHPDATLAAPIVPPTPPTTTAGQTAWAPTHVVPAGGLSAWQAPDPASAPTATMEPGLAVRLLDQRDDGWAHVACSNGWTAWVDGRRLVTRGAATPTRASGILASWQFAAGAVLLVAGVALVTLGLLGGP